VADEKKAREATADLEPALLEAQTRLYAERKQGFLLVLQGMDACGKDGVVKHVISMFSPAGVRVTAFKAPTDIEKRHHFLWRFRPLLPSPGTIAVFNRSHYEDVGIVKVHGWVTPQVVERRYSDINKFEQEAVEHGIAVVKCFLHVSYDEQRQRMLDRLADPAKRWKFKESDLDERAKWEEYMAAYDAAIRCTSTDAAPWFVIPADHKWYRDWAVSHLILERLRAMDPQYPLMADLDLPALRRRLKGST
jgi:PPK2 family polyphosphate:nucleotide phosphotransferase